MAAAAAAAFAVVAWGSDPHSLDLIKRGRQCYKNIYVPGLSVCVCVSMWDCLCEASVKNETKFKAKGSAKCQQFQWNKGSESARTGELWGEAECDCVCLHFLLPLLTYRLSRSPTAHADLLRLDAMAI